jgi:hypothetical protein
LLGLLLLVVGAGCLYGFYRVMVQRHSISVVESQSPHRDGSETPRSEETKPPSAEGTPQPGTSLPQAPVTIHCHTVTLADIGQDPRNVHPGCGVPSALGGLVSSLRGVSLPSRCGDWLSTTEIECLCTMTR